jgi:hypothetical protein
MKRSIAFIGACAFALSAQAANDNTTPLASYTALIKCDGSTDDAAAIANAISFAQRSSRPVQLPGGVCVIGRTIAVPAGVVLAGEGRGTTALSAPNSGTVLKYTGSGDAVSLDGSLSGLERIAIVGTPAAAGAGVLVNGNGNVVESWHLDHVTVYGFTAGTGVKLQAVNRGVVAYGSAIDVRIRNARVGIHVVDTGGASGFANTNQFYGGAINGGDGIFDYAIRVQGGNDNRIVGMSVEPYSSRHGHIVIESGWIRFDGRLEGTNQPPSTPLVDVWPTAGPSTIDGLGGGGLVLNRGAAAIGMTGGKHAEPAQTAENLFPNPGFAGADTGAHTIQDWTVTETGGRTQWALDKSSIVAGYQSIRIDVPAGGNVELKPASVPTLPDNTVHNVVFGLWVKTTAAQSAFARINAQSGVASSSAHSGSGSWEAVSMSQAFSTRAPADPRFELPGGAAGATYYVTAPYFAYGYARPDNAAHLKTSGGTLYGAFEGGAYTITLPASGDSTNYTSASSELTAPKWGNTIHIAGAAHPIARLNSLAASRWAAGTQVRLIFDVGGITVSNSAYITLAAAFASAEPANKAARSWLLLESNGDGTWYELDRRN